MKSSRLKNRIFSYLRKTLTRADLILIVFLVLGTLASFSLWFRGGAGQKVIIQVDEQIVKTLSLSGENEGMVMEGAQGPFSIQIRDGKVRMTDSACPNKLCVKRGWISQEGQVICCIPNRVIIKIIADKEKTPYDALAR